MKLFGWADVDRAVGFGLAFRIAQAATAGLTLLLVAHFFSPELQGYLYAFASLLTLQVYAELGLYLVITVRASHEWAELNLDADRNIVGDRLALSRLASLARFVVRWYSVASFAFIGVVGIAGHIFFQSTGDTSVVWQGPWWAAVLLSGLHLWSLPIYGFIEGCNQVVDLNRFRLVQTLVEAALSWALIVGGAGLWLVAVAFAVKLLMAALFIAARYRAPIRSLAGALAGEPMNWKSEIWPMQWRLAAQAVTHYLVYSIITPVIFVFHGPVQAGQIGMTMQIMFGLQMVAGAWMQARTPQLGVLVARRRYAELDGLWSRGARSAIAFIVVGVTAFDAAALALRYYDLELGERLLTPLPLLITGAAYILMQFYANRAAYLRAHGREPFLVIGVAAGLLNGALVLVLGERFAALGATVALLTTATFLLLTSRVVWERRRREWQARE